MMWGYGGDGFWLAGAISALIGLAILVGFIVLIVFGVRWLIRADKNSRLVGPGGSGGVRGDPLDVLRERYARGEIDDEEYERRRKTLTGG